MKRTWILQKIRKGAAYRVRAAAGSLREDEGAGVIEVLLILVVLIAVVILFKEQILALADLIFGDMFAKAESVF